MVDSLLSEVDADVRAERAAQLWARYRRPLFTAIALVIALTAADSIWQHFAEKRGGALLIRFTEAQALYDQGKAKEAADAFAAIATDTSGETKTMAELWQGRALTAANDNAGAIAIFTSASSGTPGLWSDLACLRLASLDHTAATTCLASSKETPLLNQRREWQAAVLASAGKHDEAVAMFEEIATSQDTSDAARARINQWISTMHAETGKSAE
jgi:hypothetical protein